MDFGEFGSFPFTFGGEEEPHEIIYHALLEEYGKVFDVSEGTIVEAEAWAEAAILSEVAIATERLRGQRIPARMLEARQKWEQACRLRPTLQDTVADRVAALEAKFRGLGPNAEPDINSVARAFLGAHHVATRYVESDETITYMPGFNPGPPGLEWCSNLERVFFQVQKLGLTDEQFTRKMTDFEKHMGDFLPSWMDCTWGIWDEYDGEEGFILDMSILGEVAV